MYRLKSIFVFSATVFTGVLLTLHLNAQPCLSSWAYRVPVTITNTTASALTDFQVRFETNTADLVLNGKARADGGDIRIVDNSGAGLPFWIETGTYNTSSTKLWTKVPSIPASGSVTVYLFYGNASASSASNGNTTFELFDDFAGSAVDASKWTVCNTGTVTVSGGRISMTAESALTSFNNVSTPVKLIMQVTDYDLANDGRTFIGLINDGTQMGYMGGARSVVGTTRMINRRIQPPGATCYTFDNETLSGATISPLGIWEFSWPALGEQSITIDGVDFTESNNSITPASNQKIVFGNSDLNGEISIDYLFARKYASGDPSAVPGSELNINVPPITATNNGTLCEGRDLQLSVTEVPGATYTWKDPGNQDLAFVREPVIPDVTVTHAGKYSVTVSIPGGCSSALAETTVTIDATTQPGTLGNDNTVCFGNNNGSIDLTSNTGDVVRWETSQTGDAPWATVNNTSTVLNYFNLINTAYYRTIVKNGVCDEEESNTVAITVNALTVAGEISGTSEVCEGDNKVDLRLAGRTGDIVRWESSVNDGSTWITVPLTDPQVSLEDLTEDTQYRAVVKSGVCAEQISSALAVNVNPLPAPAFETVAVCEGEIMSFTNTTSLADGNVTSYLWEFGDGSSAASANPKHTYLVSGEHAVTLTATSDGGCVQSLTANVEAYAKPEIDFIYSQTCDGFPTLFGNQTTIATGDISEYDWDFGDGTGSSAVNPEKQYFNAGTYLVILNALSSNGCNASASRNVTVDNLPLASFSAQDVCLGEAMFFNNASFYNAGALTFEWQFGDGNTGIAASPDHTYDAPGVYEAKLIATTARGCQDSLSRSVHVRTLVGGSAGADVSISKGSGVQLNASGGVAYVWEPSDGLSNPTVSNPIASPAETTTYTVLITDALGCQATDDVIVTVIDDFAVQAMNILTPNGDGVNDTWKISNIENYGDADVYVYDRNGMKVFSASAYSNDWQGTYRNDILPDGTYYYVIQFANTSLSYSGALTILRNEK